ncbi:MAG: DUF2927 domain-containing protein [Paracoccaceae bacterium]|nr:DUF2927 domain-containing protein [Paracoccaceae bacterium]
MRIVFSLLAAATLAACAAPQAPVDRRVPELDLPPMKTFSTPQVTRTSKSNREIARDFMELSFALESGRQLPVFTRFEGPVTVRVTGRNAPSLGRDLDRLLGRLRREAGIDIARAAPDAPASITIEVVARRELQRAVPQAACFVVPRVTSWDEFRRFRNAPRLDWTTLETRETMAIFLPGDVSPQEIRDCLHEELAQALGPLNDLYRLSDSVFNDDNFHTVLTGFDMLILAATYAPELRSGMSRDAVAAALPGILNRLNPRGRGGGPVSSDPTPRAWINAIETALGPRATSTRRRVAAREAVAIATQERWTDTRLAFSLYALGRLTLGSEPELALASFLQAGALYRSNETTQLQAAHISMQLAAFALSAGQPDVAIDIVDDALRPVAEAENAALLSTLLMVKAEALDVLGRRDEAAEVRLDSLGWARYGFGSDVEVRARAREIAALAPPLRSDRS